MSRSQSDNELSLSQGLLRKKTTFNCHRGIFVLWEKETRNIVYIKHNLSL